MELLKRIWGTADLRKRILYTIGLIIIFRIAGHITVPGIDPAAVKAAFASGSGGGALQIFSVLTGGSMERFSIVMMGLAPFINASIIVQLMTVVIPKLEQYKNEGEAGQRKIQNITRWLTLPLALVQSYGMIILISNLGGRSAVPVIDTSSFTEMASAMITVTAGTLFLMWLGELITENGLGNGISLLIFTGIITAMPAVIGGIMEDAAFGGGAATPFAVFILVTLVLLVLTVIVMDAQRNVQIVNAARSATGEKTTLPIRLLQAGMIPVIFAVSLLTFPTVIAQLLSGAESQWVKDVALWWTSRFNADNVTVHYLVAYFLLIIIFTYFYVSIVFNPTKVAENIQKNGGFIPGIRPGAETAKYLGDVSNRMNLWGGIFLGFVAMVPLIFTMFTSLTQQQLVISGAGLIIIVSVVLELIRQVNARLSTHDYGKLG